MAAPTRFVNPNAEVVSKTQALMVNVAAARGLQNVLKTNLGEWRDCSSCLFSDLRSLHASVLQLDEKGTNIHPWSGSA